VVGSIAWHTDDNTMEDMWLVLTWGVAPVPARAG
jgi:hypothetical protein